MTDLKNKFSLLVGSEKSKSYPGTQASKDAQGPGCPPYSGVGKDPLSLTTDRQTPASPLDLTSLAAAIPIDAPAPAACASAWTLVAPKKRRKGKTTKTDTNTDDLGRGGKQADSDRPTTDAGDLAGSGEGRSEERPLPSSGRPLEDTRAGPGFFTGEHVERRRPGPDCDPTTSRESGTSTTRAGQTAAKDKVNEGDRTDPDGNPIRARGATGPSSFNTARPQTSTTNKTNAHNLPNSRTHPRFRKRNRGTTHKTNNNPGTSVPSSQPNNKRDRLDDTISPRGEHKRPRKDWQGRNTRGSYATATQSHLDVAITTTPRLDLTPTEANGIQGLIQKAIFAACLKPPAPGQAPYAPAFDGKAFPSEGVLKMRCLDDQALSWLKTVVPTLTSPREGTGLTVIHQSEIITKVRSGLYVPDFDGEIGQLHQVLSLQNPWYGVSRWTLFSHQVTASSPPGLFLILGIPKEELPTIIARGRKVAYSTGSIYIRFFTSEGLSDVPPGQNEAPEVRGVPDVDRVMEVDGPNSQRPSTPEPSVSKVLENIEAVLTEAKADMPEHQESTSTPNATDTTAPADQSPAQRAHTG